MVLFEKREGRTFLEKFIEFVDVLDSLKESKSKNGFIWDEKRQISLFEAESQENSFGNTQHNVMDI